MQGNELHAFAVEALKTGRLPAFEVRRFLGGFGTDQPCPLCRRPVLSRELSAQVDHPAGSLSLHIPCFRAWQEVVLEPLRTSAGS